MPHLTVNEFKAMLIDTPLNQVVEEHILGGETYAFRKRPILMNEIQRHLTARLPVTAENIIIVGSAKTGFSLNPDAYFNPFTDDSDIDVAIIDESLFDEIWFTLLNWHYPRRYIGLDHINSRWVGHRQKEIYWGWLTPDKIRYEGLYFPSALKRFRDLTTAWFNAFRSFSLYPELARREVSGRLYRTRRHALFYQVEGLRQLREFLQTVKE
jgi:hypothetical protein